MIPILLIFMDRFLFWHSILASTRKTIRTNVDIVVIDDDNWKDNLMRWSFRTDRDLICLISPRSISIESKTVSDHRNHSALHISTDWSENIRISKESVLEFNRNQISDRYSASNLIKEGLRDSIRPRSKPTTETTNSMDFDFWNEDDSSSMDSIGGELSKCFCLELYCCQPILDSSHLAYWRKRW